MPNPNVSQLRLIKRYGYGDIDDDDTQTPIIYDAVSEDSDQTDHKYVHGVPIGGVYVELAHYTSVKHIVIQNLSNFNGMTFYADATTGALVPGFVLPGQEVSFNDPNVTIGVWLYSIAVAEPTEWHLTIVGQRED